MQRSTGILGPGIMSKGITSVGNLESIFVIKIFINEKRLIQGG